jgi:fatty-acyl-CoA synthase
VALCARSGLIGPELPHRVAQVALAFERFGMLGGAMATAAIRHGGRVGLIDELGELTYRELDARSNAVANGWRERGLEPGEGVAILVRNHRGFIDATFAAAKCGARIVLLNTDFAARQLEEVASREGTDLLVFDDEYTEMLEGVHPRRGRFLAWNEGRPSDDSLEGLIASGNSSAPPKPGLAPKITILTSGTTGTPKGAPRDLPRSLAPIGGLLSKVPFQARETTELCAPMFHALGFAHAMLGVGLGSTLVVRRRFDPEATLESLDHNQVRAIVVVPVMLQRMLDLDPEFRSRLDLSELRIIFVSGSQLGAELCRRALREFGPVVYNLYDRGGVRDDRDPRGSRGRAGVRGQGRPRHGREDS